MPQYMITYLGGNQPSSPEQGQKHFARYKQWLASLGDAVVSPMNPLKGASTVEADGSVTAGGKTTMSGYTIVAADSMEAALEMARACPFLDIGGSLEVSEMVQMPG
ncbi:MAG: YciI family protein [Arenicella sp.]|nr:YciI family protein [Arenicella sp.]